MFLCPMLQDLGVERGSLNCKTCSKQEQERFFKESCTPCESSSLTHRHTILRLYSFRAIFLELQKRGNMKTASSAALAFGVLASKPASVDAFVVAHPALVLQPCSSSGETAMDIRR